MTAQGLKLLAEKQPDPDKLPVAFSAEFCREAALDLSLEWAGHSRFKLVDLVFPGKYKPWQFGETLLWLEGGDIKEKAREAVEWIMTVRLGCGRGELPQSLTAELMKEIGLESLLEKFEGSVFSLVQAIYPGVYKPWQFPDEEAVIWFQENKHDTARSAVKWLIENRLGIAVEEIPRRLTLANFHQHGLSKLLDLYNQNLYLVVENAYPGLFKPWEYSEQTELWHSQDALSIAREATFWLISQRLQWDAANAMAQLTRRQFVNHGLGHMLGFMFNHSPFMAIENAFPELKNNEIFQKALFVYSQEMHDLVTRWAAMAEYSIA